jgi:hypothetical protein
MNASCRKANCANHKLCSPHADRHTCCSAAFLCGCVMPVEDRLLISFLMTEFPERFRRPLYCVNLTEKSLIPCRSIGRANEGSVSASVWQWPSRQAMRTFAHFLSRWRGNGSTSRNSPNGTIGKRHGASAPFERRSAESFGVNSSCPRKCRRRFLRCWRKLMQPRSTDKAEPLSAYRLRTQRPVSAF